MLRKIYLLTLLLAHTTLSLTAQIDTSFVYNPSTSYGSLDIRIAKSSSEYYYLKEGETFSYREASGVRTKTFVDMTAWDSEKYSEGHLREKRGEQDLFVMNYRMLTPSGYNADYSNGYPLVILLHGSLERGNCSDNKCYHASRLYSPNENQPPAPTTASSQLLNNDYNLVHGGSNYLEAHNISGSSLPDEPSLSPRAFPGFVVFPQNLNGWDEFSAQDAIRLVRLLAKKYNIDRNRIYINGVSNGGKGTYEVIKRAPWLFAAAVLFSAADDASIIDQRAVDNILNVPLWIFQGGVDAKPTRKQTEGYIKRFTEAGVKVRYTLYPQLGHGTWNKAFAEPDFFSWMLRQRKNNLRIDGEHAIICKPSGEGARLTMPEGFASYQWEYNNEIIEGAVDAYYVADQVGRYRGRFSIYTATEETWNEWSDVVEVSEKNPTPIEIQQRSTLLLKDPNGKNETVIEARHGYKQTYWYKNGNLLNFPGDEDDTITIAKIEDRFGDGNYYVQASGDDGCKTPPGSLKKIIFSDRAPVTLASPEEFSGEVISPSQIKLSWQDASDNEAGFEIWRRRKTESENYTLWEMATISGTNIMTFDDHHLVPSSTYQYIIRAVNESARSEYNPSLTQPLEVTTAPDNENPSAPTELTASVIGIKKIQLHWNSASDNSSISNYRIHFNDSTASTASRDTTFILTNVDINTDYAIHVVAIDAGKNESEPSNEVYINTAVEGLYYQHSTGAWDNLEQIDWSVAEFTGMVDNFTMSPKTQDDFFNIRFEGYLHIQRDGIYQFRISSDDGSKLTLGDSLVLENDGIHNFATETAPIQLLDAGAHRIIVDFFDYVSSDSVLVEYKGPDSENAWIPIPTSALRSDVVTSVEDPETVEAFSVYPNPNNQRGPITVRFESLPTAPVSFSLIDYLGKEVQTEKANTLSGSEYTMTIARELDPGVYILRVSSGRHLRTRKVIFTR